MDLQFIGADLGRGYVKGYTEYKGKAKSCIFKSGVAAGRDLDFSEFSNPLYLEINGEPTFIGDLAEKEGFNYEPNYKDDKTSESAEKLLYALLYELAESEFVSVCIGVPNKNFNKATLDAVSNKYNGKKIVVRDVIKNVVKVINIVRVNIFRESDAALMHVINTHPRKSELKNKRLGMVTVGFRTTELTYFDVNMKFNDKLSDTKELGNRTVLDAVAATLKRDGISKELNEIDADNSYNGIKSLGYKSLLNKIDQLIEMTWTNWREMELFLAGGTSLNFKTIPSKFELVKDSQTVTAKGLYFIAEMRG